MPRVTQIAVTLQNKPGALAQLCSTLGDAGVNISAVDGAVIAGRGKVRLLVDNPDKAKDALKAAKIRFSEEEAKSDDNKPQYCYGIFALNVCLLVVLLYVLAGIWPAAAANASGNQTLTQWPMNETVSVFMRSYTLSGEVTVLLIVMLMGALGSLVYSTHTLVTKVANKKFESQWTLWYLGHPLLGSSLAVIFYVLVRGGLVNLSVSTGGLNLYGVATVAGIVGFCSLEGTKKLKDMFDTLFGGTPSSSQQYSLTMLASGPGSVTPQSGKYDKGAKVTITATADSDHSFTSWTGTGDGSYSGNSGNSTYTITMKGDITETATFT
jgi:predicted amino acid-binding ACT domain protein